FIGSLKCQLRLVLQALRARTMYSAPWPLLGILNLKKKICGYNAMCSVAYQRMAYNDDLRLSRFVLRPGAVEPPYVVLSSGALQTEDNTRVGSKPGESRRRRSRTHCALPCSTNRDIGVRTDFSAKDSCIIKRQKTKTRLQHENVRLALDCNQA